MIVWTSYINFIHFNFEVDNTIWAEKLIFGKLAVTRIYVTGHN